MTTTKWDAAEILVNDEITTAYIQESFEQGEHRMILKALRSVVQFQDIRAVAARAGLSPESVKEALLENGDPTLSTLLPLLHALGFKLIPKRLGE